MVRRVAVLVLLATLIPAAADTPADQLDRQCRDAGVPPIVCDAMLAAEHGAARAGVSFSDFTHDSNATIDIADFAFAPRLAIVHDQQMVAFTNRNRTGGNPHSVASDDIGSDSPVLPVPLASFGGGRAFRSGRLLPGEPFFLQVNLGTMDPRGYQVLPTGDVLISYHCYIHGSAQMNGQLLVRAA